MANLIDGIVKDSTLRTAVTDILLNTFGVSDQVNITFSEEVLTGSNSDATAITDPSSPAGVYTAEIKFNSTIIANASQEYLVKTLLHEIYHAYLYTNAKLKDELLTQHEFMAKNYVAVQILSMKKIFPNLSNYDAKCLVIGGYGAMQIGSSKSIEALNSLLAANNITKDEVVTINSKYQQGKKGTNCKQ